MMAQIPTPGRVRRFSSFLYFVRRSSILAERTVSSKHDDVSTCWTYPNPNPKSLACRPLSRSGAADSHGSKSKIEDISIPGLHTYMYTYTSDLPPIQPNPPSHHQVISHLNQVFGNVPHLQSIISQCSSASSNVL